MFRSGYRALAPTAWISFIGLCMFLPHATELGLSIIAGVGLFVALCLISLFDIRYFIIPDGPLIFLCILAPFSLSTPDPQEISLRLAAGAVGYSVLRLSAYAHEVVRGQAGFGTGDARLYAVAGLWLGLTGLPGCLVYATFSALLSAVIALRLGEVDDMREPVPFGPHLSLGMWLSYVMGPLEFG